MFKPTHFLAAALIASFAPAKVLAADGPAFPGNEALRIVNGKRVAELPPLSAGQAATAKSYAKTGTKGVPPKDQEVGVVYMIETNDGLIECRNLITTIGECRPSSLGRDVKNRLWPVKLSGKWQTCDSRAANRKCGELTSMMFIGARE